MRCAEKPPIPGWQFVEAVDLVLADPGEPIGEVGLRVQAGEFGAFDQGHGISDIVATRVGPGKQVILATDADRAHGAFGGIVIDGDANDLGDVLPIRLCCDS